MVVCDQDSASGSQILPGRRRAAPWCHGSPGATRSSARRRSAAPARACPRCPSPPSDSSKAKPRPSSPTSQLDAAIFPALRSAPRCASAPAWRAALDERLLGDPVDDQLGVVAEVGEVALGDRTPPRSRPRPSCSTWPGDRRRQAEVVERGRAQLAGEREQLAHRLVGERLGLGQLGLQLRRRRLARPPRGAAAAPVSDWLTSSWRSRATRARSSSWACSAALPGPPPLGFEAPHHPQEGELDPLHLLGLADAVDRVAAAAAPGRLRSTFSISSISRSSGREAAPQQRRLTAGRCARRAQADRWPRARPTQRRRSRRDAFRSSVWATSARRRIRA